MADIRNFIQEKEKRKSNRQVLHEEIARRRRFVWMRRLAIAAAAAALVAVIWVQADRRVYTSYDTVRSVQRTGVSNSVDRRLQDCVLTYSRDGAHCTDGEGKVTWNQTYEIQDLRVATCRNVSAIAGYNDREIYVQNTEGLLGEIATNLPIRDITVAANGYVTAVLADTDLVWINTYSPTGELVCEGQARMTDTGYPMALSLSPNAELLMISYVYVDAGILKSQIAFYNFGPVGTNQSDYMVSVFGCPDTLIPTVRFMNASQAFALGDGRLNIYSGDQIPKESGVFFFDQEVLSVYSSDKYIGLVFASDQPEGRYKLQVYTPGSDKVGIYYFDLEYRDIFFEDNGFVVYNETECLVMNLDGREKYRGYFSKAVNMMIPADGAYRYLVTTDTSIDTIQLK